MNCRFVTLYFRSLCVMHQLVHGCCVWGWITEWCGVLVYDLFVGSNPAMTDWPWLLISSGTGPVISRVIKSFWIKVSAKWLLSHSHKLLGRLILLLQCVSAVTVFLGKRWGVRADASLKPLLLSSFAHSLFPVCHWLPSCHLYFSVRSVGLWSVSVSFLKMTVSSVRPGDSGSRSSGMLGRGEWRIPRVWVILQVSLWDSCSMFTEMFVSTASYLCPSYSCFGENLSKSNLTNWCTNTTFPSWYNSRVFRMIQYDSRLFCRYQ